MKKVLLALCLMTGLVFCQKDNTKYQSKGLITGPDIRMCACCGGWFITIDSTTYRFDSLPENATIDLQKVTFPVKVLLNWSLSSRPVCSEKIIDIQGIVIDN